MSYVTLFNNFSINTCTTGNNKIESLYYIDHKKACLFDKAYMKCVHISPISRAQLH